MHSWDFTVESLYWRSSSSIGIFILEVVQSPWNVYTGGLPVGIFILEGFQFHSGIFILEGFQSGV
jgi:hypothetical protein